MATYVELRDKLDLEEVARLNDVLRVDAENQWRAQDAAERKARARSERAR